MGNESSKAVGADHAIDTPEFDSDTFDGCRSQVPNNSPASTKIQNTIPILQSSKSEDIIERDEGSFLTMSPHSEMSDLVARSETSNCARNVSVELSSQSAALAAVKEFISIPQPSHVDVTQEQIRRALNNLSFPPRCPSITSPGNDTLQSHIFPDGRNTEGDIVAESSDIDPGIPPSFKLSTAKTDENTVLSKPSVSQTKLKPHAPEFIPRRHLHDNNISIAATLSDVTNLGPGACPSTCTKTPPAPQRQNVFEGRDLPPHLSFRDANHLYRPIPIQAPPAANQQQSKDPVPPKIPNFVSPLPAEIENLNPSIEINECECNIPSAATYAEAANLAIQYPGIASEILVQPLSSVIRGSPLQNKYNKAKIDVPCEYERGDMSYLTKPTDPEQLQAAPVVAIHTTGVPNWAAAPLPLQPPFPNEESRRNSRNRRGRNLKQHNSGDRYERWDSRNYGGQPKDRMDHIGGPAVSEFYQTPPHQQQFFKIPNNIGGQSSERVVIDQKLQEICDRPVTSSFHVFKSRRQPPMQRSNFADASIGYGPVRAVVPSHEPSVSAISGLAVEEEATKLLALAKMYNIDLPDLLRLIEPSGMPGTEIEGSYEQQKELLPRQSAPFYKIQARTEKVVYGRLWNTPSDILPENSLGKSPLVNHSVVSPSSVFVPTCAPLPAPVAPVSIHARRNIPDEAGISLETMIWNERVDNDRISVWSRRGGSLHAAFPNTSSNSLARSRMHTSAEPWSRQQTSRVGTKYNLDLENKAAFTIVDKLEGGTKEVFLRHGTHLSSKAASSCALANTNHQVGQPKNGGCGDYGTFTPCGKA